MDGVTCDPFYVYLSITPVVSAFTWVTAISLVVLTCIRIAETVRGGGRLMLARYDVAGLRPVAAGDDDDDDDESRAIEQRPNALKILVGVRLWEANFRFRHLNIFETVNLKISLRGEGRRIVLSRGIIALLFMALILAFAFSSLIVDPAHEASELPVMTSFFAKDPSTWMAQKLYIIVVRYISVIHFFLLLT